MTSDNRERRFPWRLFWYELSGTAVLVLVGLSLVIVMFGTSSPMPQLIPSVGLRQLITTWHGALGAQYKASDTWLFTGGVAYDSSGVAKEGCRPLF